MINIPKLHHRNSSSNRASREFVHLYICLQLPHHPPLARSRLNACFRSNPHNPAAAKPLRFLKNEKPKDRRHRSGIWNTDSAQSGSSS